MQKRKNSCEFGYNLINRFVLSMKKLEEELQSEAERKKEELKAIETDVEEKKVIVIDVFIKYILIK